MNIKKKISMKSRNIRFPQEHWDKIVQDAQELDVTCSDVVRHIVKSFYEGQLNQS